MDFKKFCGLLQRFRKAKGWSLKELAERTQLKIGQLHQLEVNDARERGVAPYIVDRLAVALDLSEGERQELFGAAHLPYTSKAFSEQALSTVRDIMDDPALTSEQKQVFVQEMKDFTVRWRELRRVRLDGVKTAIIPAAGWQPRLFRHERYQRSLLPALAEVSDAKIETVVVVVPANSPELTVLKELYPRMITVTQADPRGLGDAILVAKEYIEDKPFALVLPDDIDEGGTCLRDIGRLFQTVQKPIITVDATPLHEDERALARNFGIAILSDQLVPGRSKRLFQVLEPILEKPDNPNLSAKARRVVGRYILTPELVNKFASDAAATGRADFASAINSLWVPKELCAYRLEKPLRSLAPLRDLIRQMESMDIFDVTYYRDH